MATIVKIPSTKKGGPTRWRALVRTKGYSKSKTCRSKQEAQAWASSTEARIHAGDLHLPGHLAKHHTLGELIDRFMDEGHPRQIKEETRAAYYYNCRRYWKPTLGHIRLDRLNRSLLIRAIEQANTKNDREVLSSAQYRL